ncbi:ATP-binding protein [Streptomyces sp. NPDC091272]|uniref:ATP-binding protein n=1 Tax=Streptomyces sp. NPDC091272 TaxID=3365981 RepID=UPI00382AC8E2
MNSGGSESGDGPRSTPLLTGQPRPAPTGHVFPALTGRDEQTRIIEAALDGVTGTAVPRACVPAPVPPVGTSVVLRGEPGTGRTALLAVAESMARHKGLRVLRMAGSEAESELPYAALHQVLWPLLGEAAPGLLTASQRAVLERALGVRGGQSPRWGAVAEAVHCLVADAAAVRPLVLLLDDLQWADAASAAVFGRLVRRPAPLPVVVIGATRTVTAPAHTTEAGGPEPYGVRADDTLWDRTVRLGPLDEACSEALLRRLHPWLPDLARRWVLRTAGGNPLALHELPPRLRAAAQDHPAFLVDPEEAELLQFHDELPLGDRLGGLYAPRLRMLSDEARRLLLVIALAGRSARRVSFLRGVAAHESVAGARAAAVWNEVAGSGLARADEARDAVVLHHPLVRGGLVHLASPAQRRTAHRVLADALPAGSRPHLMHRAAATIGTDDELAALLAREAQDMAAGGSDAEAAGVMARAASLSSQATDRATRLVSGALMAARGGRVRLAAELRTRAESEARPATPGPPPSYAFVVAYTRLLLDGDPVPAAELLPAAMDLLASPAGRTYRAGLLGPSLLLLMIVAVHTADERAWAAVERHAPGVSEEAALCLRAWTGREATAHGDGLFGPQARPTAHGVAPRESAASWLLLWTAAAVDQVGEYGATVKPLVRRSAFSAPAFVDGLRAHDHFLHGRWDEALEESRRGARESAAYGYAFHETLFALHEAQVLAARGDRDALAAREAVFAPRAREQRLRAVAERWDWLRVQCALAHGRVDEAWHHAAVLVPGGTLARRTPWLHLSLVDWTQAAVGSGRGTLARRQLRAVRAAGIAHRSPHHSFLVTVAEALAADDEEREARYAAVYAHGGADRWPFPLARARLAHGRRLRQLGPHGLAASHLRAALTAFTGLGATPWATQAARELEGLDPEGLTSEGREGVSRGNGPQSSLTAQELRIAGLAAEGLSNRQIGDRLGLSPRTIGAYLYKLFPKLGITTRAALARALDEISRHG